MKTPNETVPNPKPDDGQNAVSSDAVNAQQAKSEFGRKSVKWLKWLGFAICILLLAVFILGRESSLQWLARQIANGQTLQIEQVSGSLYGPMRIGKIKSQSPQQLIEVKDLQLDWSPRQLLRGQLTLNSLQIARLEISVLAPSTTPLTMPDSLAVPLRIAAPKLQIGEIIYRDGGQTQRLHDFSLGVLFHDGQWQLQAGQLASPWGEINLDAKLAAKQPFALHGKLSLRHSKGAASLQAQGNLQDLQLLAEAQQAGENRANLKAMIHPFAQIPLSQLALKLNGVNPAQWQAAWPQAMIGMQVDIAVSKDAAHQISGKFMLDNQLANSVDAQAIPVKHLQFDLLGAWSQAAVAAKKLPELDIKALALDLGTAGQMHGQLSLKQQQLLLQLNTEGVNLHGLHSSLYPSKIKGQIEIRQAGTDMAAGQELRANLAQDGMQLEVLAHLRNQLLKLERAKLTAKASEIALTGQIALAGKQEFSAQGKLAHVDPAKWGKYPAADINASFQAKGNASAQWQVMTDLVLQKSQLFAQDLRGKASLQADAARVHAVDVDLQLGRNHLLAKGALGQPQDRLNWQIDAPQLNNLHSAASGQLKASGQISGNLQQARTSLNLQARELAWAGSAAAPTQPSLAAAKGSLVQIEGQLGLQKPFAVQLSGHSQGMNPAAFGAYPAALLNTEFSLKGQVAQDWQIGPWDASLNILPTSRWVKADLSGQLQAQFAAGHVRQVKLELQVGANHLQAQGTLGQINDELRWQLDAPELAQFDPRTADAAASKAGQVFSGKLKAEGKLSGAWDSLSLQAKLQANTLKFAPNQTVQEVNLDLLWPGIRSQALQLDFKLKQLQAGNLQLSNFNAQASGTPNAHVFTIAALGEGINAELALQGGFAAGTSWQGQIKKISNQGRYPIALQAPATLALAFNDGNLQSLQLQALNLKLGTGQVQLEQLERRAGVWLSRGQLAHFPVLYLLPNLLAGTAEDLRSDLQMKGNWQFEMGNQLNAHLLVERESGDVRVAGSSHGSLGMRQLQAQVDIVQGKLNAALLFDSQRGGNFNFTANTELSHQGDTWHLPDASALAMRGQAQLASLAWLSPLLGIPDLELDGKLKLDMRASGSIGAPELAGNINGEQLALSWPGLGLKLRNGQLQARLAQDQLLLESLQVDGQQGSAKAQGWLKFADKALQMQIALQADKLQVLARPDRQLVMSGKAQLFMNHKQIKLEGNLRADSAKIELATQNSANFSDDVVILGAAPKVNKTASLPLVVDVEFDLGDHFQLSGSGLQAQLAGALHLKAFDRRGPRATGSISVSSGSYTAYGQKLQIERGVLNFSGALDNPAINLLAVRKTQDAENGVEAGIELRGTLLAPQARLVSTPAVPDSEKLMWLVLGHGSEGSSDKDNQLLGLAANALFGGAQTGKLASALALDEINLSRASGLESTVVTVGKRISSKAFLSFEQGAGTASTLVKLRYTFNPRLSVQLQTGTNNAVDAFYTWRFD